MQRLIAFLLRKFTPFRVVAWHGDKIAGIGYPTTGVRRKRTGSAYYYDVCYLRTRDASQAIELAEAAKARVVGG